jgi:hypothetical protein
LVAALFVINVTACCRFTRGEAGRSRRRRGAASGPLSMATAEALGKVLAGFARIFTGAGKTVLTG